MAFKVAVVGATGNVGREMLNILEERGFPVSEVVALASRRSVGTEVSFGDRTLKVKALENYDFSDTDICLMSAGGDVSKEWSPKIGKQGCIVIDNSSAWRYDQDVPLIVPEVNPRRHRRLHQAQHHRQPELLDRPARRGAEAAARSRHHQARRRLHLSVGLRRRQGRHGRTVPADPRRLRRRSVENKKFTKRIAFNVIPHIDVFMDDGFTKEEWKMVAETKKMLDPKIKLTATCVRVPVFIGHSEAVNIEFEKPITADEARDILRDAPGCLVIDKRENGGYITPLESAGEDATYISPHPRGFDSRQRPVHVDRLGQSAQGRRAQRHPDCRASARARPGAAQEEGGLISLTGRTAAPASGGPHAVAAPPPARASA